MPARPLPGTTRPPITTPALATNTAPAQALLGPHITTHLCQDRATGTVFERGNGSAKMDLDVVVIPRAESSTEPRMVEEERVQF